MVRILDYLTVRTIQEQKRKDRIRSLEHELEQARTHAADKAGQYGNTFLVVDGDNRTGSLGTNTLIRFLTDDGEYSVSVRDGNLCIDSDMPFNIASRPNVRGYGPVGARGLTLHAVSGS